MKNVFVFLIKINYKKQPEDQATLHSKLMLTEETAVNLFKFLLQNWDILLSKIEIGILYLLNGSPTTVSTDSIETWPNCYNCKCQKLF